MWMVLLPPPLQAQQGDTSLHILKSLELSAMGGDQHPGPQPASAKLQTPMGLIYLCCHLGNWQSLGRECFRGELDPCPLDLGVS